jgi:muramoyltetrapeptide carboxypeptidase
VVAPSGPLADHTAALEAGVRRLEAAGARVRLDTRRVEQRARGYLAGEDDARAAELLAALTEEGVDVVWAARGGSGLARLGPALLSAAALHRTAPRIVVGFSDITTVLTYLTSALGWITFHGPVVTSLGRPDRVAFDLEAGLAMLRGETHEVRLTSPATATIDGRLRGGNLTVLASLAGTPLAARPLTPEPELWVLEDVGETPYRLDRSWTQLLSSGALDSAGAVWLGQSWRRFCAAIPWTSKLVAYQAQKLSEPISDSISAGCGYAREKRYQCLGVGGIASQVRGSGAFHGDAHMAAGAGRAEPESRPLCAGMIEASGSQGISGPGVPSGAAIEPDVDLQWPRDFLGECYGASMARLRRVS